jgi:phosphoadenosine phosphosulfate reductase
MKLNDRLISILNEEYEGSDPSRILEWTVDTFSDDAVLSTGFGASGIVLMHQLSIVRPGAPVFYLDTDLLFDETNELIDRIRERMDIRLIRVRPEYTLDQQAAEFGEKLWESRPDQCCHIRKVLPLKNFLKDKKAWMTAIRRDQSATRKDTPIFQLDEWLDVLKVCPLAGWSEDEIWSYLHVNRLPYNELHDRGYPSIGCWPCTRPAATNGDLRAGRWSGTAKTECGLHNRR